MNAEVTHADPRCPIWHLDVHEGVELYNSNIGPYLSVGIVNTDISIAEQTAKLLEIQGAVRETCLKCPYHTRKSGYCEPGGIFMRGMFCDLVVAQRDQIPQKMKNNPEYHYSDF